MKVGFIGKGGSGKTTVCALTARIAAKSGYRVTAIDADINQHLASALGLSDQDIENAPKLDDDQAYVKDFLRGKNPRINPSSFFKTTPPGAGSRLIGVSDDNPIEQRFGVRTQGLTLMMCGIHRQDDIGVHCYHGKTSVVDMILNHTVDGKNEFLLVDMTAGADAFSSTLFSRFDLLVLVVEPTIKSVAVLKQYEKLGAGYDLPLLVLGNKVTGEDDLQFLKEQVGDYFAGALSDSKFVRNMERGKFDPIDQLEAHNRALLSTIFETAQRQEKNWDKYLSQLLDIHRRIGPAWGGGAPKDLLDQIDPDFTYPDAPNWNRV